MGKRLYVGNLTYGTTDASLRQMFEAHGSVTTAQVIMDRDTGRSKGFGFVEMGNDEEAQAAIAALNGQQVDGRALTVNEARPKTESGGGDRGPWRLRRRWRRPALLIQSGKPKPTVQRGNEMPPHPFWGCDGCFISSFPFPD